MATGIAAAGLALAAGSAYVSYSQGKEAEKSAKQMAAANAKRAQEESDEAGRRLRETQAENLADARARAAASGVGTSGSQGTFLAGLEQEQMAELGWLERSGQSRSDLLIQEGNLAGEQAANRGTSGAIGQIGGVIDAGQKWYNTL